MGRLKSIYVVQRKIGKSNRWETTHWNVENTLVSCKIGITEARERYPKENFRICKIDRVQSELDH